GLASSDDTLAQEGATTLQPVTPGVGAVGAAGARGGNIGRYSLQDARLFAERMFLQFADAVGDPSIGQELLRRAQNLAAAIPQAEREALLASLPSVTLEELDHDLRNGDPRRFALFLGLHLPPQHVPNRDGAISRKLDEDYPGIQLAVDLTSAFAN